MMEVICNVLAVPPIFHEAITKNEDDETERYFGEPRFTKLSHVIESQSIARGLQGLRRALRLIRRRRSGGNRPH